jgi:hypothetical protein
MAFFVLVERHNKKMGRVSGPKSPQKVAKCPSVLAIVWQSQAKPQNAALQIFFRE